MSTLVKRIAVEGNIASGKSTFLQVLSFRSPRFNVVSEPVSKWQNVPVAKGRHEKEQEVEESSRNFGGNLLQLFYKAPSRWAYTFQSYACLSRLKAQLGAPSSKLLNQRDPVELLERSVYSDKLCFAINCWKEKLISDMEWHIYCDWHAFLLEKLLINLDGFIYLRSSPKVCMERLQRRARKEENQVNLQYLEAIHQRHEDWLMNVHNPHPPVLVLNCDEEFENNEEVKNRMVEKVVEFIAGLTTDE